MSTIETVAPAEPVDLVSVIAERFPALTGQEQQAAQFIVEHLGDVVVYTSAELAELSGVSGSTLSRLYRKLGFADAGAFRQAARALHVPGDPYAPILPGAPQASIIDRHLAAEHAALQRTFQKIGAAQLDASRRLLVESHEVHVVGLRNAYPLALHLREQLLQLRAGVHLLPQPGQTLAEELVDLPDGSCAVLFGLRRRPAEFGAILRELNRQGVPTILVADPTVRARRAQLPRPELVTLLEVELPTHSMLASFTAAASVVELLAAQAVTEPAKGRVRRIDRVYRDLHELEQPLQTEGSRPDEQ